MPSILAVLMLILTLTEALARAPLRVIVDGLDWQETSTLPGPSQERLNAQSVGDLILPQTQDPCTAFLISEEVIMTNYHCVKNQGQALGTRLILGKAMDVPLALWREFNCEELLIADAALDMALLKCQGSPGSLYGVLTLDEHGQLKKGDPIYLIQQNCDYYENEGCQRLSKIAWGEMVQGEREGELAYSADSLSGSSGSPLFSAATQKVLGLHHAGHALADLEPEHGDKNYAISMALIVPFIRQHLPQLKLKEL